MTEELLITLIVCGTLYALSIVMETYVKRYYPEVWEELNRWED